LDEREAMHLPFPFSVTRGTVDSTDDDDWVVGLIEQVLFTIPGERVNRPAFGCGVETLVFQADSAQLTTAAQYLVQSELQRCLSGLAQITSLTTSSVPPVLLITIEYVNLVTSSPRRVSFEVKSRG
jgi:uncharacterized protein